VREGSSISSVLVGVCVGSHSTPGMPQENAVGPLDVLLGSCSVGMVSVRTPPEDALAGVVGNAGDDVDTGAGVDTGDCADSGGDGHAASSRTPPKQTTAVRRASRPSTARSARSVLGGHRE
jgi:hypothetical protein